MDLCNFEPTMEIVRFCAIECKLQMSGELSVYQMLTAYEFAYDNMAGPIIQEDILTLGHLVQPNDNLITHFRKVDVRVGFDVKAPWEEVPRLINQLLEAQGNLKPEEFFKEFEDIHPFRDGNGRTGAILFNYLNNTMYHPVWPPNFWNDPRRTVGWGAQMAGMLDEIRKRDSSYGEKIPDHYQGPHDRRYLLKLVDLLQKEIEKYERDYQIMKNRLKCQKITAQIGPFQDGFYWVELCGKWKGHRKSRSKHLQDKIETKVLPGNWQDFFRPIRKQLKGRNLKWLIEAICKSGRLFV